MHYVMFQPISNAGDWIESIELRAEDDDSPLWTTVPADLVATLSLKESYTNHINSDSTAALLLSTADADGRLTAFDNGFLEIDVPDDDMTAIDAGKYSVFLKLQTDGRTMQFMIGTIPIVAGA